MNKLLQIREWVTPREAAEYLSICFKERVREADIYRLGLDGHLTISVNFVNNAHVYCGRTVSREEAGDFEIMLQPGKAEKVPQGILLPDNTVLQINHEDLRSVDGVWDLPMVGAERFSVEQKFQELTGGPDVNLVGLDGGFVISQNRQLWLQIQERGDNSDFISDSDREKYGVQRRFWYPANGLPEDSAMVVRTAILKEFVEKALGARNALDRPLQTRERESLLTLIGVLARQCNVPLSNPTSASNLVARWVSAAGGELAPRTIENHLRAAARLLDRE